MFITMNGKVKTAIEKSTAPCEKRYLAMLMPSIAKSGPERAVRQQDVEEPKRQIERPEEREGHHRPHKLAIANLADQDVGERVAKDEVQDRRDTPAR